MTAFSGERCRSGCNAGVFRRGVAPRPPEPQVLGAPRRTARSSATASVAVAMCFRRSPLKPSAARPVPAVAANASLRSGHRCARHRNSCSGSDVLCNHPHMPPSAAASALCSAPMPGRPARGRRSQTSTRPTLLRSQPNTRHPRDRVRIRSDRVDVELFVRFKRTGSDGGELRPVSSTDSTARRGRR